MERVPLWRAPSCEQRMRDGDQEEESRLVVLREGGKEEARDSNQSIGGMLWDAERRWPQP